VEWYVKCAREALTADAEGNISSHHIYRKFKSPSCILYSKQISDSFEKKNKCQIVSGKQQILDNLTMLQPTKKMYGKHFSS
jgi:hypothetical protein